jgi:hypothetical protein
MNSGQWFEQEQTFNWQVLPDICNGRSVLNSYSKYVDKETANICFILDGPHTGRFLNTSMHSGHPGGGTQGTRIGKPGSSGAAAVVHEETAALEDMQSFLDESAKHEAQTEHAVAKRHLYKTKF